MKKIKKNAFTLIEVITVIVILGIILAIALPTITNIIKSSTRNAFESDAKLVLKAISYKELNDDSFDKTKITEENIGEILGLSNNNYSSTNIAMEDNNPVISIIGTNKWDGFIACGTFQNMKVVENGSDCEGDNTPPVITILGSNPVNLNIGSLYVEEGATATDNLTGNITDNIVTISNVDVSSSGSYSVIYKVTDLFGNVRVVKRTVNVIDNVYPAITFNPSESSIYQKTTNTTIDVTDLGIIDKISQKYVWTTTETEPASSEFVNSYDDNDIISTPSGLTGTYYLWATATDSVGNKTTTHTGPFNLDNTVPVITLNGESTININKGSSYIDDGATVTDEHSGINGDIVTTSTLNTNIVGTYTITYNVSDKALNQAIPVTRTINVIDVLAPIITINGTNPITINAGSIYIDEGATATDETDGDVTSKIIMVSTVNPSVVGTYAVTYKVSDTAGNAATSTRTVNVVDNTAPVIAVSMNGNSTYAKTISTTVTVTDQYGTLSTLKYLWSTSAAVPSEASFNTSFVSDYSISSPAEVTGLYYLWILAKDNSENTTIQKTNAFYLDNTPPVITLIGSSPINIAINSTYNDLGATATDTSDGNITNRIIATSTVATGAGGTYTVTYNVSDMAGNTATATRTVIVRYCQSGTLVNDPTYGYICSTVASSTSSCNSCTYQVSNYGANCSSCGSTCSITGTTSNVATTTYSCPSGYTSSGSGSTMTCSKTTTVSPSTTTGSAYCSEATYTMSGGSCVRTVSCSGCSGQGVDCMNIKCGSGGWTNSTWTCGTSTCTATMAIRYTCSTGTNDNVYSSTCYYCPSGYTTSGTGSSTTCSKVTTTSNVATTTYSCPSGYTSSGSGSTMTCSKVTTTTSSSTCPNGYTTVSCNTCTYNTSTSGANCTSCGTTYNYYCGTGWSNYTGTGSSLTCYKTAN